jgi:Fur family ferric uptake transcriptional regulator
VDEPRLEAILAGLRRRGGRVTTPRRAIVAELLEAGGHITAEELAARVGARFPDVSESTIYRTLNLLTEYGVVVHVHLGHGPAVYHLADETHHHLVCESCGAVVEVPVDVFSGLRRRLQRDYGFDVDASHFAFAGRCAACA